MTEDAQPNIINDVAPDSPFKIKFPIECSEERQMEIDESGRITNIKMPNTLLK